MRGIICICIFQNRTFVFGASSAPGQVQKQQQQQPDKPAFNFSAGMQPNFNFGGAGNAEAQVRYLLEQIVGAI